MTRSVNNPVDRPRAGASLRRYWRALVPLTLWAFVAPFGPTIIRALRPEAAASAAQLASNHQRFLWIGTALCVTAGLMYATAASGWFARRAVGVATARDLGWCRVAVCFTLLATLFLEDLGNLGVLPAEVRDPTSIFAPLYTLPLGLNWLVSTPPALVALHWLIGLTLFLAMVGWRTRVTLPLSAIACLALGAVVRDYSYYWHNGLVPTYALLALCFTPSGDGLSLDRRRTGVPDDVPRPVYAWGRILCWATIVLPYVLCGLSKLRLSGWGWWHAENLRCYVLRDSVGLRTFNTGLGQILLDAPDFVFDAIGLFTLVGEIGIVLVFFSRVARWIFPLLMFGMHLGILLLQNVPFFDMLIIQLVFLDVAILVRGWRRLRPQAFAFTRPERPNASQPVAIATARPDSPSFLERLQPALIVLTVIILVGAWVGRIERYPLTAMEMYAKPAAGKPIHFERLVAHLADGRQTSLNLDELTPALSAYNTRYRVFINLAFDGRPHSQRRAEAYLSHVMRERNATARGPDRVVAVDVQQWSWDSPTAGGGLGAVRQLEKSRRFEAADAGSLTAAR